MFKKLLRGLARQVYILRTAQWQKRFGGSALAKFARWECREPEGPLIGFPAFFFVMGDGLQRVPHSSRFLR